MSELVYNEKFEPLFNPPAGIRYFIVTGGRYSSKSYSVSTAVCTLINNHNHRALYTRYTLTSAKDSIIPEFQEKIDLLGLSDYYASFSDRIVGAGKRKIVFKGIHTSDGNQTAKLKSLKDFSIFVLDEAEEENDEDNFDKINLSIRANDVQNFVILILNPTTKNHWIYNRFFERKGVQGGFNGVKDNVCYIHTTYLDAIEYVPQDYLYEIETMKIENPLKYNHIMLGGWVEKADGVILSNWKYGPFDNTLPYAYGQDFGYRDPDALVKFAVNKAQKKIYVKEEIYQKGLSTNALGVLIKAKNPLNKLIVADSAATRTIEDLKGQGINIIPVTKGLINDDIKMLQDYEIIVDPDSINLGRELNTWVWLDKKSEVPLDDNNHLIDALRYIAKTIIKPFIKRPKQRAL
jgi:phage terminase large subunit